MLKAVAFDMDDTLLSINLSAFIAVYARDEARLLADIGRRNPFSTLASLLGVLRDLNSNIRPAEDTRTNLAFYNDEIERRLGIPLTDPVIADALEFYEREVLPELNDPLIGARPQRGAQQAVDMLLNRGLRIALFTNPAFSRTCIECRMGWGNMLDMPFELVTCMENSTRCKPDPRYYLESIAELGLEPEEVLMVGNDPKRDFPTPDCGIQTAYVGGGAPPRALWHGSMEEFAAGFDAIEKRFYERQEHGFSKLAQGISRARNPLGA